MTDAEGHSGKLARALVAVRATWNKVPALRRRDLLLGLGLVALTLGAFGHVCANGLVNYDDDVYVTSNLSVLGGLDFDSVGWAFTATVSNHWHPLTWLSLQLDSGLFDCQPWGYHLTNLLLHVLNVLLLFAVWRRMTGAAWRSAAVAALFAVHPLHVESVAWVTERKDVLSTFFGLLALLAYVAHARRPSLRSYALVLLAFACGLGAKPMLMTLPGVLLLLDYWPLCRLSFSPRPSEEVPVQGPVSVLRLLAEKVPLLALAAASGAASLYARQQGGGLKSGEYLDLHDRVGYALLAGAGYLQKTFWPSGLAAFYPLRPGGPPADEVYWAAALLVGLSVLALALARRRPYLIVGWLWYVGTLLPVSGLVQFGSYALADRYTYVPLIGIFVALVWATADLVPAWLRWRALAPLTALLLLACVGLTWRQVRTWHDSVALWEHALAVVPDNFLARTNLGVALTDEGRLDEAREHLTAAGRLRPDLPLAHQNLGRLAEKEGKTAEAVACFRKAVELRPHMARYRFALARALRQQGQVEAAEAELRLARQLR